MPRWHKHSTFGPGHRVPLDREQKAQIKARLHLQRRPGRITLAAEKIGNAMVAMMGADGRLDPGHHHLAKVAGVAASTVRRALERLRQCGFLDWTRRLIRTRAGCQQTSNAYVLRLPDPDAHFERPVILIEKKKEAREQGKATPTALAMLEAARWLPDLLLARRRAWEAGLVVRS